VEPMGAPLVGGHHHYRGVAARDPRTQPVPVSRSGYYAWPSVELNRFRSAPLSVGLADPLAQQLIRDPQLGSDGSL
jgi:hypothetical protein